MFRKTKQTLTGLKFIPKPGKIFSNMMCEDTGPLCLLKQQPSFSRSGSLYCARGTGQCLIPLLILNPVADRCALKKKTNWIRTCLVQSLSLILSPFLCQAVRHRIKVGKTGLSPTWCLAAGAGYPLHDIGSTPPILDRTRPDRTR